MAQQRRETRRVAGIAGGVGLVALLGLMIVGGAGFVAALFLALASVVVVVVILLVVNERRRPAAHGSKATAGVDAGAGTPAPRAEAATGAVERSRGKVAEPVNDTAEPDKGNRSQAAEPSRGAVGENTGAPAAEPGPETDAARERHEDQASGRADASEPSQQGDETVAPSADTSPAVRPKALSGPRDGQADDLKRIRGIGPKIEEQLNEAGIFHFDQIADWSGEEVAWIDQNVGGFVGRVRREDWVGQAHALASGPDPAEPT